jgi:hypothetical protein
MSDAEIWADVDQIAAAHVLDAWRDGERWPAIGQALQQIMRESEQQLATESHGRLIAVASRRDIQLLEPEAVISTRPPI